MTEKVIYLFQKKKEDKREKEDRKRQAAIKRLIRRAKVLKW